MKTMRLAFALISVPGLLVSAFAHAQSFTDRPDLIDDLTTDPSVAETGQYKDVDIADLDGDGLLDVVLVKSRGTNPDAALINGCLSGVPPCAGSAGNFTLELADPLAAATMPQDLFNTSTFVSYDSDTVDLDRDGRVDFLRVDSRDFLLGGSNAPRVRTWMNQACAVAPDCPHGFRLVDETDTRIGTTEVPAMDGPWDDADFADINEDGFIDIGLANRVTGGQQTFMINLGEGQEGEFVSVVAADTIGAYSHDIDFGDLDDDGWMDFVMAEWTPTTNYVYFHTRELVDQMIDGNLVSVPVYQMVPLGGNDYDSWTVQLLDVDGDDDLDVFIGNRLDTDQIFRNDGAGNLTEVTASIFDESAMIEPMSNLYTYDAGFGDIDNDGDIDIVTTQADNSYLEDHNVLYVYNSATGVFEGISQPEFNPTPVAGDSDTWGPSLAATFGDLDNDGALDVFFGAHQFDSPPQQPRIYINDDTSTDAIDPNITSVTTWLDPPDGSAFAVKARITDRVIRLDEITADVQFTLSGGPALPAQSMYSVGGNTYRTHLSCAQIGANSITDFTITATDASGNVSTDGPHAVGLGIVAPTTADPAAIGAGPWNKLLNVQLDLAPFVANLEQSLSNLSVTVGGIAAPIVNAYAVPGAGGDEVWLTVDLPAGLATGLHDIVVDFDICGNIETATAVDAVNLSNFDWALAIDRSGSMGFEADKMPAAKNAAKLFLDLNESGDKIGAAWFAGTLAGGMGQAVELFPMTAESALPDPTDPDPTSPYNLIDGLSPSGSTSIAAGLVEARNIFEAQADVDEGEPIFVIISDGRENTEPFWDTSSTYYSPGDVTISGDFVGSFPVYTIALGEDADQALLQRIASETGGQYFYLTLSEIEDLGMASILDTLLPAAHAAPLTQASPLSLRLSEVYKRIQESGASEQRILSTVLNLTARLPGANDTVGHAATLRQVRFPAKQIVTFDVEESAGGLTLAVHWSDPGSGAQALLVSPDGALVTAGPNVRIRNEDTHITYKIGDPQAGTWQLALGVLSKPMQTVVMASVRSNLTLDLSAPGEMSALDADVPIRLLVQGFGQGATLLDHDAWVVDPDGDRHPIQFLDDGSQADGRRNDNLLGALFSQTDDGGTFRVEVELNGEAPGIGDFTRSLATTFSVTERDTDGDGLPDRWERQHGTNPALYDAHLDPDGDGLNNFHERHWGTDPFDADTDDGGTNDGTEVRLRLEPLDPSDDSEADRDNNANGIPDLWEELYGLPTDSDTSNDDPDGDGLTNGEEYENNTRPDKPDSDGDGLSDGDEVAQGSDPRNADDTTPHDTDEPKLLFWLLLLLLIILLIWWLLRR